MRIVTCRRVGAEVRDAIQGVEKEQEQIEASKTRLRLPADVVCTILGAARSQKPPTISSKHYI